MKKILTLCMLITVSNILHAAVYTFTTDGGVLKLNDQMNTISFKGMMYTFLVYKPQGVVSKLKFISETLDITEYTGYMKGTIDFGNFY